MANAKIIETSGLNFSFKKGIITLDNVNMVVTSGNIFGFLGPNGAGKTTTLRLLLGLLTSRGVLNYLEKIFIITGLKY